MHTQGLLGGGGSVRERERSGPLVVGGVKQWWGHSVVLGVREDVWRLLMKVISFLN